MSKDLFVCRCERIVTDFIKNNDFFEFAYGVAKENWGDSEMYLLGGMVYRPIINELYGIPIKNDIDYDFLVDYDITGGQKDLILPSGWELGYTHLGNYKITKGLARIDYLSANERVSEVDRGKLPSMSMVDKALSYLEQVPLSLQSIAYNLKTGELIGSVSLQSIKTQTVWIHCDTAAQEYTSMYNMNSYEYMNKKYADLGFKFLLD